MIDIEAMAPDELRRRLRETMADNDRLRRTLGESPAVQPIVPPTLGAVYGCPRCGKPHGVEDVAPLQFVHCGENTILVGIEWRAIRRAR